MDHSGITNLDPGVCPSDQSVTLGPIPTESTSSTISQSSGTTIVLTTGQFLAQTQQQQQPKIMMLGEVSNGVLTTPIDGSSLSQVTSSYNVQYSVKTFDDSHLPQHQSQNSLSSSNSLDLISRPASTPTVTTNLPSFRHIAPNANSGSMVFSLTTPSVIPKPNLLNLQGYADYANDIFQCGKCKSQYSTLQDFVAHRVDGSAQCDQLCNALAMKNGGLMQVEVDMNSNLSGGQLQHTGQSQSAFLVNIPSHFDSQQAQQQILTDSGLSQCNQSQQQNQLAAQEPMLVYENVPLSDISPSLDVRMDSISPSLLQGGEDTEDFSAYGLDLNDSSDQRLTFNGLNFDSNQSQPPPQNDLSQGSSNDPKNAQSRFVATLINNFHSTSPATFATLVNDLEAGGQQQQSVQMTSNSGVNTNQQPLVLQYDPAAQTYVAVTDESSQTTLNGDLQPRVSPEPMAMIHHGQENANGKSPTKTAKNRKPQSNSSAVGEEAALAELCNSNPLNIVSPPNVTIRNDSSIPPSAVGSQKTSSASTPNSVAGQRTPNSRSASAPTEIQCDQCSFTFTHRRDYESHMLFHEGKRKFRCNSCGRSFPKKFALRKHIQTHKQLSEEERDSLLQASCEFTLSNSVANANETKSETENSQNVDIRALIFPKPPSRTSSQSPSQEPQTAQTQSQQNGQIPKIKIKIKREAVKEELVVTSSAPNVEKEEQKTQNVDKECEPVVAKKSKIESATPVSLPVNGSTNTEEIKIEVKAETSNNDSKVESETGAGTSNAAAISTTSLSATSNSETTAPNPPPPPKPTPTFKCDQCDRCFSRRSNLNKHVQKAHPTQNGNVKEVIENDAATGQVITLASAPAFITPAGQPTPVSVNFTNGDSGELGKLTTQPIIASILVPTNFNPIEANPTQVTSWYKCGGCHALFPSHHEFQKHPCVSTHVMTTSNVVTLGAHTINAS